MNRLKKYDNCQNNIFKVINQLKHIKNLNIKNIYQLRLALKNIIILQKNIYNFKSL